MKHPLRIALGLVASSIVLAACSGGGGGGGTATVTSLYPDEGANTGGTAIVVTGENFKSGPASVLFGGVPATDVQVVSDTQITCVTPPHAMAGIDVEPVNVEVRSAGNVGTLPLGYQFVNAVETEPPAEKGVNDTFASYKRIPLDADYTGHIGAQDDVDVLHLHTPTDGRVVIDVTWNASWTSGGIAGITLEYFHGPDPSPDPDAYFGGSVTAAGDVGQAETPAIDDFLRLSYVTDGHGPFVVIRGIGSATHAGYDPVNAYTLHATFVPDTTTEPAPAADGFHFAATLTTSFVTNVSQYDQDFDWYRLPVLAADGWARVTLDAGAVGDDINVFETELSAKLFQQDATDVNVLTPVAGATLTVGDRPDTFAAVFEATTLLANRTYLLRVYNVNTPEYGGAAFGTPLRVETGTGGIEDGEPGFVSAAETEFTARTVAPGTPVNGYVFHDGDNDWFVVTATSASMTVTWDVSAVRTAIGDYDASSNPLGGTWGVMVFDEAWYLDPGHAVIASSVVTDGLDYTAGDGTRSVTVATTVGGVYYILLDSVRGIAQASQYTLTVTAN